GVPGRPARALPGGLLAVVAGRLVRRTGARRLRAADGGRGGAVARLSRGRGGRGRVEPRRRAGPGAPGGRAAGHIGAGARAHYSLTVKILSCQGDALRGWLSGTV